MLVMTDDSARLSKRAFDEENFTIYVDFLFTFPILVSSLTSLQVSVLAFWLARSEFSSPALFNGDSE